MRVPAITHLAIRIMRSAHVIPFRAARSSHVSCEVGKSKAGPDGEMPQQISQRFDLTHHHKCLTAVTAGDFADSLPTSAGGAILSHPHHEESKILDKIIQEWNRQKGEWVSSVYVRVCVCACARVRIRADRQLSTHLEGRAWLEI